MHIREQVRAIHMAALTRLRSLTRHGAHFQQEPCRVVTRRGELSLKASNPSQEMPFGTKASPALHVSPKSGLADSLLDVRATGLLPGQLVALQAEVVSECRKYKFHSRAMYQADINGQVIVSKHASLGGTYKGVEPMGLIWSCKPAPEVAHLYPRLKKMDAGEPVNFTFRLVDRSGSDGGEAMLASEVIERRFVADYVERIPVTHGKSQGVWFIPKQKGSSDPLPVVVELAGFGGAMEDRVSLWSSYGFAVYAMNYTASFHTEEDRKDTLYFDAQGILDVFDYISSHPRLDESRVGLFGFCSGSTLAMHSLSRLNLPVRCVAFSSMVDVFHSVVGFRMPDGKLLHTLGDLEECTETYEVDGRTWLRCKSPAEFEAFLCDKVLIPEDTFPPVHNISVPSLFLLNDDDQFQPSRERMLTVIDAMKEAGKGHLVETFELQGAGHLLDAPYLPITTRSRSGVRFPSTPSAYITTWGGNPPRFVHSLERAWRHVIDFYKHHLIPTEQYR